MLRAINRNYRHSCLLQSFDSAAIIVSRQIASSSLASDLDYDNSSRFFKTSETNPVNLNSTHLGRFYSISDDVYKKLYAPYHGFTKEFDDQCKIFREQCVMIRKPYLDLKRCVDGLDLEKPIVRFIIYGNHGTGKSLTLSSMIHYGYVREFVLIHMPWMPLWTLHCKEIAPSATRPGFYDHTINAVEMLINFKGQNSELIQKLNLTTTREYQWTKREITPEGSSLLEIIEHGISRPSHATDCLSALFKELKVLSSQKKCKTMVLLGGANDLFYLCTKLRKEGGKVIPQSQVTIYEVVKDLFKTDWSGGVAIATVDKLANNPRLRESELPRYLLQKEGWELFDPFVPIEVPKYTSQEVQTTIDYYLERKWLTHPAAKTEEGRLELEYLSAKNPLTLMRLCYSR